MKKMAYVLVVVIGLCAIVRAVQAEKGTVAHPVQKRTFTYE